MKSRFTIRSILLGAGRAAALLVLASLGACGGDGGKSANQEPAKPAEMPKVIRMSAIPDADPTKLKDIHTAFAAYLTSKIGIPCEFVPVTEYSGTVTAMVTKQLELCWYGGVTSVMALKETKGNAERIAMREEDKHFKSVFITGNDTGIAKLADLKGKTFTFGATMSTSGHFMPRWFLMKDGIDASRDFEGEAAHQKNHDDTIRAVASGAAAAGALNSKTWDKWVKEGKEETKKAKEFHRTPEYVDYCWVVRKDLPAELRTKIKDALLALDPANPEHKKMLDAHSASKYVPALEDSAWNQVEEAGRATNLIKD